MKPLSPEIRALVILKLEEGATQVEISEDLGIAQSTVSTISKVFRERGHLVPLKLSGRKPTYDAEDLEVLSGIINKHPDKTLVQYAELLGIALNRPSMSRSTMQRIIVRMGFSRKKKSKYAQEQRNPDVKKKESIIKTRLKMGLTMVK